ncbi:MAG: hypothetical protein Q8O14_08640 [bacterium]|jgi:hypothetical protein|nr:hypothetical protein [bacterium]
MRWIALLLVLVSGCWADLPARPGDSPPAPPDSLQLLVLTDGSRLVGRVEQETAERLWFRTSAGVLVEVETGQVSRLEPLASDQPHAELGPTGGTRLFFAPTGRSLRRGESTLGVYEVLLPFAQYGLTDWFALGGGTPLIFGSGIEHPVWLTPRFQLVRRADLGVAVGVMHLLLMGKSDAGIVYAVGTRDWQGRALTLGFGYPYGVEGDRGLALAGGEWPLSPRLTLITENYGTLDGGLASLGLRFRSGALSADLGMAAPISSSDFFAFPLVNFVWSTGRRGGT